ncbi:MAG: hypothetical protein ACE5QV_08825 [Fidelibacterota bacterium]
MDILIDVMKFLHILGVVFMSVPLFSLIIVNERARLGGGLVYSTDRYLENIIKGQSRRCYVFQLTVLTTGIVLLIIEGMGIESIIFNWVIAVKTVLLLTLMSLLSYVHFGIQPGIESLLSKVNPEGEIPEEIAAGIKPLRLRRKKLAATCLFIVITLIILGLQVVSRFNPVLTLVLIALAGLFTLRVYKSLIPFGWI